jgi:hypothetical protein
MSLGHASLKFMGCRSCQISDSQSSPLFALLTKISKEKATGGLPVRKVTSQTSPSCEQERDYVAQSCHLSIPKLMNSY